MTLYQVTVLYNHPEDVEAFNSYYKETHVPLARKIPGLVGYYVHWCEPGPDGAKPPYHAIAILLGDSKESLMAGLGAPEGKAAAGDVANFATGGAQLVFGEATSEM